MAENEQAPVQPQFAIQRIYLKDTSFESPNSPQVFIPAWKPEVSMDLNSKTRSVGEDLYEVVLTLTATAKNNDETAFLVEVQQAGLFAIKGLEGQPLQHTLSAFCPNILFPYAREAIDNLTTKGSFPSLNLAPVNFDALYAERLNQEAEPQEETQEVAQTH